MSEENIDKTYVILDKSIIRKYPKLLGLHIPHIKFVIVKTFISEINKDERKGLLSINQNLNNELVCLINSASDLGLIILEGSDYEALIDLNDNENLISGWEILSIIKKRKELEEKGHKVKVAVTEERKYSVTSSDDVVLSEMKILDLLKEYEFTLDDNPDFKLSILKYQLLPIIILVKNFFLGLAIFLIGWLIISNFNYLTSTFDSRILTGIGGCFGICLYLIRENFRSAYGLVEVLVGVITLYKTIDSNESLNLHWNYILGILGGLYIIVRGLDNLVKAQKDTPFGIRLKDNLGVGS